MRDFSGEIGARYDALPYPGYSFPETHLSRLAAIGRLHGLDAPDPRRARVLELGCGTGINLLAMAQLFPDARFHGVDVSSVHTHQAIATAQATGICNTTFRCLDLLSLEKDPNGYDYILCHGVYSWVPDHVRQAILGIIRESLRPAGIALLSYNCRPGWDFRGALRGMMLMHAGEKDSIGERVIRSRDLMRFLTNEVSKETAYGRFLQEESAYLEGREDAYIAHEMLEAENKAFYLRDFMKEASDYGLSYLGDARAMVTGVEELRPAPANWIREAASTPLEREQYLDFIRMRMFRSTLLCRTGIGTSESSESSRIGGLQVCGWIRLKQPYGAGLPAVVTTREGAEISLNHPVAAVLFSRLAELGELPVEGSTLLDEVIQRMENIPEAGNPSRWRGDLETLLLRGYRKGMLDLRIAFPQGPTASPIPDLPRTLPLARWQVAHKLPVSGRDLALFRPDALTGKMIMLCDGSQRKEELLTLLARSYEAGEFAIAGIAGRDLQQIHQILEAGYDEMIRRLEALGVLDRV